MGSEDVIATSYLNEQQLPNDSERKGVIKFNAKEIDYKETREALWAYVGRTRRDPIDCNGHGQLRRRELRWRLVHLVNMGV